MKGNQLLILTTTWITLQINERSQTQDKEGDIVSEAQEEAHQSMELWYKKNWPERGERELSGVMKMFHQVLVGGDDFQNS